jgi:hypothetical protein
VEPEETSISRQRFGISLGNGYASNNRGVVGNDFFCSVRAKWQEKKGASELGLSWQSGCEEKTLRVLGYSDMWSA